MKEILSIPAGNVLPTRERVLEQAGVPLTTAPRPQVEELVVKAMDLLNQNVQPRGMYAAVCISEFERIYHGDGRNDPETPLQAIYPEADTLALFAVTLGEPLSNLIHELFNAQDFALGHMLDAAASEAVERAGENLEQHYIASLQSAGFVRPGSGLLRYSPGYCGWHMSGQKALFAALNPGEIGITLGESFLMHPIKSMSGVMVMGRHEIHIFDNIFPFCVDCRDWNCRERIHYVVSRSGIAEPAPSSGAGSALRTDNKVPTARSTN